MNATGTRPRILLAIAFALLALPLVSAHDASVTHTTVNLSDDGVIVTYFPKGNTTSPDRFTSQFLIQDSNSSCPAAFLGEENGSYTYNYSCGTLHIVNVTVLSDDPQYSNVGLFTLAGKSTEYVFNGRYSGFIIPVDQLYIAWGIGRNTTEAVPFTAAPGAGADFDPPLSQKIWQFFRLGVRHILTGYDHMLFLLGLLIMIAYFRQLLTVITSFTVAHSITLILAALGAIALPARLTESLIALSIVVIAAENLYLLMLKQERRRPGRFMDPDNRWLVVFLFGLVHGLGFSGVLKEIGLPKSGLVASLISFNLGIEAGQLLIVALLFPALWYTRKRWWHTRLVAITSIIIGLAGLFWFIQRVF